MVALMEAPIPKSLKKPILNRVKITFWQMYAVFSEPFDTIGIQLNPVKSYPQGEWEIGPS